MFLKLISTQPLHSRGLEQLSVVVKTSVAFYMVITENTNKNNNNKKNSIDNDAFKMFYRQHENMINLSCSFEQFY